MADFGKWNGNEALNDVSDANSKNIEKHGPYHEENAHHTRQVHSHQQNSGRVWSVFKSCLTGGLKKN